MLFLGDICLPFIPAGDRARTVYSLGIGDEVTRIKAMKVIRSRASTTLSINKDINTRHW